MQDLPWRECPFRSLEQIVLSGFEWRLATNMPPTMGMKLFNIIFIHTTHMYKVCLCVGVCLFTLDDMYEINIYCMDMLNHAPFNPW